MRSLLSSFLRSWCGDRQVDVDAADDHRRHHHEDDQQHQHHVDQRGDVDLRPDLPLGRRLRGRARGRAAASADHGKVGHAVASQDRVDQLGRGLVDVDGDVVDPRDEVVVEPDRDDRDAEADGGGDQRLGDAGRHGADAAAALGRVGELLKRGDDAADGAEQADERRRRRDRRQHRQAAAQAGELALLAPLHGAVDGLGDLEGGRGGPGAIEAARVFVQPAPITLATGLPAKRSSSPTASRSRPAPSTIGASGAM